MRTRWVITKVDSSGLRVLAVANQGRNHYDTELEAKTALDAIMKGTDHKTLQMVWGDLTKVGILDVECHDHGDAVGTVYGFDKDYPLPQLALENNITLYAASMGKVFRVRWICRSDEEANLVMARNRDVGLIATDKNGLLYLAELYGAVAPSAIMADIRSKNSTGGNS